MEEKYEIHTLSNGIRIVHRRVTGKVAHCGLLINTGSRDEGEDEWGMAHFIEHVIFKGTTKRKSFHVLSRLENVGGDLNAYTTKEETCVHATFLNQYYDRSLELISDIVFNSIFPFKELEKEKEVVIDEINSYQDSPSELIFDDFEDQMFNGYPIGRNILGSPELVKSFNKEKIIKFMDKAYNTDEMVISSVGNISFAKLVRIVEKYFAHIPANPRSFTRIIPVDYAVSNNVVERNTYQSHCIMGNLAYSATDEKRITLGMLTNILGGPGLNSRLNLNLREKHGLAYNVEANYSPYADKGIFNIYFGCDHEDLNKCFSICNKEMKKLKDKKLGILQFRTAQQQLLGQMAISSENNENQMLSIGKSIILYDRVDTLESIYKKIAHVSANDLLEVANEIFEPSTMSTLIYK
jgi:predicted Zn-dependent peptidase